MRQINSIAEFGLAKEARRTGRSRATEHGSFGIGGAVAAQQGAQTKLGGAAVRVDSKAVAECSVLLPCLHCCCEWSGCGLLSVWTHLEQGGWS